MLSGFLIIAGLLAAQIEGFVVDQDGKPVEAIALHHTGHRYGADKTDASGQFALQTKAPAFVLRKAGFVSQHVRVQTGTPMRIVVQRETAPRVYPTCAADDESVGLDRPGASFRFPRLTDVAVDPIGTAPLSSYRERIYRANGGAEITHAGSIHWGLGLPTNREVWRAADFEEATYLFEGVIEVTDARGKLPDGTRWRQLGILGETATYSGVDEASAKLLDQVLDGGCLTKRYFTRP